MLPGAELRAGQVEFVDLTSQSIGATGSMNLLTEGCNSAAPREATAIGNLQATDVSRDALSRNLTLARRGENRMEASLTNLPTEVDGCLVTSSLCHLTTWLRSEAGLAPLCTLCIKPVGRT